MLDDEISVVVVHEHSRTLRSRGDRLALGALQLDEIVDGPVVRDTVDPPEHLLVDKERERLDAKTLHPTVVRVHVWTRVFVFWCTSSFGFGTPHRVFEFFGTPRRVVACSCFRHAPSRRTLTASCLGWHSVH